MADDRDALSWTAAVPGATVWAMIAGGSMASAAQTTRNLNMLDLTGYGRLAKLTTLTDRMINDASRDALIAATRLLALQVAHFQRLHGALPLDENIDLLESKGLTEEQAERVADGLEVLAMALATIRDDEPDPSLQ
jgi:hypothetical protein